MRRNSRGVKLDAPHRSSIYHQLNLQTDNLRQWCEIAVIVQAERARSQVKSSDAGRAVHVLKLLQAGVRTTVRVHQAIHAEVTSVGVFAHITTVRILVGAVRVSAAIDHMIAPLPHETAHEAWVTLDFVEILF